MKVRRCGRGELMIALKYLLTAINTHTRTHTETERERETVAGRQGPNPNTVCDLAPLHARSLNSCKQHAVVKQ